MTGYNWLQLLKPGDDVLVVSSYIGAIPEVRQVDRKTATQIIIGSTRYRVSDGRELGGSTWRRDWLEQATSEAITTARNQKRRRDLIYQLDHTTWRLLPLEVLEEVATALTKAKGEFQ